MHGNESYLKHLTDLEIMQLIVDAELLGKNHLRALKEQLERVRGKGDAHLFPL